MSEVTFTDLQRIPQNTTDLIVLSVDRAMPADFMAMVDQLREVFPRLADGRPRVAVLAGGMRLEQLNDGALAALGLKRIDSQEEAERHYQDWRKSMEIDTGGSDEHSY